MPQIDDAVLTIPTIFQANKLPMSSTVFILANMFIRAHKKRCILLLLLL